MEIFQFLIHLFELNYFFICHRNLISQFQREETQLFVLRVMVGLVILYDHVHPQGAFVKASNVDVSIPFILFHLWASRSFLSYII